MVGFVTPVSAADLNGIYVTTFSGGLDYFNLTEQGGYVTGYLQIVSVNLNVSDGVERHNVPVSGTVNGSRIAFNVNGHQWTADAGWGGFTANIPQASGQIAQVWFRHSSIDEVNRMVAAITQSGNAQKNTANVQAQAARNYANAQAELTDSQQRLANDENLYRPRALEAIIADKKKLAAAIQKKNEADAKLVEMQQIAAQAHQTADDAKAAAVTDQEKYDADSLEYKADSADYKVDSAKYNVTAAQQQIEWAETALNNDKNNLAKVDARIAQLRGIIAADKRFLNIP